MNWLWNWKSVAVAVLIGWAYLPTISGLFDKWMNDPQYSHGFLVPFFSLYLLVRRMPAGGLKPSPLPVIGFAVLAVALACRAIAAGIFFPWLDAFSMLLSLTAVAVVCGGWPALRWSWPAIFFLLFAIPLPYAMEVAMGGSLQKVATLGSTFALQTLGQPAINEGNVILIREIPLNVAEACSGLRMLVTFGAFCVGAVILMERHWLTRTLVLVSCVPIALGTNILRITITGLACVYLGQDSTVVHWLHDFYGWLMMPVGLALLGLELWVLKHLLVEQPRKVTTS